MDELGDQAALPEALAGRGIGIGGIGLGERVHESGEEHTAGTQHAKAFRPHGAHVFGEDIRDGMKEEIEAAIAVGREPRHVAAPASQRQAPALTRQQIHDGHPKRRCAASARLTRKLHDRRRSARIALRVVLKRSS